MKIILPEVIPGDLGSADEACKALSRVLLDVSRMSVVLPPKAIAARVTYHLMQLDPETKALFGPTLKGFDQ